MVGLAEWLDHAVVFLAQTLAWLVLGVVVFLFGQWPVRDLLVGTGLVQGRPQVYLNDYGQLMHATVFLVGIPYALVTDRHVRFDVFRGRFSPRLRAVIEALGHVLIVLPWAAVLAYFSSDVVSRSLATAETFPDTGSPGYPLMRLAFVLFLALLVMGSVARVLVSVSEAVARHPEDIAVLVPVVKIAPQEALTPGAADDATVEER